MPVKCTVILLVQDADGIAARLVHWTDLPDNTPTPPSPPGLAHSLLRGDNPPETTARRHAATRSALKSLFGSFVDQKYNTTPA